METDNHGVSGDRRKRKPVVGKGEELPGTGRPGMVSGRGGAGGRRGASSSGDLSDVRERTRWFLRERMFQAEGRAHAKPRGGAMSARPWGVACGRAGGPWRLRGVLAPSFTFHGKGDSFATGHLRHRGTPLQKYRFLGSSVKMHGSRPPWEPFCCGSDMFSPFSLAFVFCVLGLGPLLSLEYRKLVFCAGKQQSGAQDGNLSGWFFTTVRPFALLICLRIYKSEEIPPRVCPAHPTENTGWSRLPVQPCPLQTASHRQPEVILRREVSLVICFRGALG